MSKKIDYGRVVTLDESSYQRWKLQITLMLKAHDVWDVVSGSAPAPVDVVLLAAWEKKDVQAQAMMVPTLDRAQTNHIYNCKTAKEMFDRLRDVNSDSSTLNRQHILTSFLNYKITASQSVLDAFMDIEQLARSLNEIGVVIDDTTVITKIVSSLPEQRFHAFKKAWDSVPEESQSMTMLLARLRKEELQRLQANKDEKTQGGKSAAYSSTSSSASSFKTPQTHPTKAYEKKVSQGGNTRITELKKRTNCRNCGKRGHWHLECRAPKQNQRTSDTQGSPQHSVSQSKSTRQSHGNLASAFVGMCGDESLNSEFLWISDSGASNHITGRSEWFVEYRQYESPRSVSLTDHNIAKAVGIGTVQIEAYMQGEWRLCTISDVLLIPGAVNLFSEGVMASKGYQIVRNDKETIYYEFSGERGPEAFVRDRMYIMNFRQRTPVALASRPELWHQRLAHINMQYIKDSVKRQAVSGVPPKELEGIFSCEACHLGKESRKPFPPIREKSTAKPGEKIHADLCGKMPVPSLGGANYFLLLKDDATSFRSVYFLKSKDQTPECIKNHVQFIETQTGNSVKKFKSDNGTEFLNNELSKFFTEKGIVHQTTAPYCPESNGRIEREMRTVKDTARAMMKNADLPESLWGEAVATSIYVHNRLLNSQSPTCTAYEQIFGRKPNLQHLRVFGCTAYAQIPKEHRRVWDSKARKLILVGYDSNSQKYRLFDPEHRTISMARNVSFDNQLEDVSLSKLAKSDDELDEAEDGIDESQKDEATSEAETEEIGNTSESYNEDSNQLPHASTTPDVHVSGEKPRNLLIIVKTADGTYEARLPSQGTKKTVLKLSEKAKPHKPTTRTLRDRSTLQPPDRYQAHLVMTEAPKDFQEAISGIDAHKWKIAIKEELTSHERNQTWKLVNRPHHANILDSRWLFKVKTSGDGQPERHKARLVIRGFRQRYGTDYTETFAPVCRYESIRLVLALAASQNLYIKQFDVTTAFLYGSLEETIYMSVPEGVEVKEENQVCLLQKSLYGLKQSPRCWNSTFAEFLSEINIIPTASDPSVFHGHFNGSRVILLLYVDDGLILSTEEKVVTSILHQIGKRFEIKVTHPSTFVGMQLQRDQESGKIVLFQSALIQKLLRDFNMTECKPSSVPMQTGLNLFPGENCVEQLPFRQLVGSLLFISRTTRPDISYAVSKLSQFLSCYDETHWKVAKGIVRYLKGTAILGLKYESNSDPRVVGFSDSDYAGDHLDRKSTTGIAFFFGQSLISWFCQKQPIVAVSSTEAEYVALATGAKEAVWLRSFAEELGCIQTDPTTLYVDNQSSINLAYNPEYHSRSKHIDVRFHFSRNLIKEKKLDVTYIPTNLQAADILTKPLGKNKFHEMRELLKMEEIQKAEDLTNTDTTPELKVKHKWRGLLNLPLMLLMLLTVVSGTMTTHTFQRAQPVIWRGMKTPVTRGNYQVDLSIKLVNTCELLTSEMFHTELLGQVRAKCQQMYTEMFINELEKMCPNQTPIALMGNKNIIISRPKRIIIITILGFIAVTIVAAVGLGVAGVSMAAVNTGKINSLTAEVSEQDKKQKELEKRLELVGFALNNLKSDYKKMIDHLEIHESDYLELKAKHVTSTFIISYITTRLMLAKHIVQEANHLWEDGKIHSGLMDYFNFSLPCEEECPLFLAKPRKCRLSPDKLELELNFDVPVLNKTLQLLEADPFQLRLKKGNQTCSIIYVGPQNAVISKEAECLTIINIKEHSHQDMIFFPSSGCTPHSELPTGTKYFAIDYCLPEHPLDELKFVQVKPHFGLIYVYCAGSNLTINGKTHPCPEEVFVMSISGTFYINNVEFVGSQVHFDHHETIDPFFTMKTNWNLQPKLNLSNFLVTPDMEEPPSTQKEEDWVQHPLTWTVTAASFILIGTMIGITIYCFRNRKLHVTVLPMPTPPGLQTENMELENIQSTRD